MSSEERERGTGRKSSEGESEGVVRKRREEEKKEGVEVETR